VAKLTPLSEAALLAVPLYTVELTVATAAPLLTVMVPRVTVVFAIVLPTLRVDAFTVTVLENMWLFVQLNVPEVLTPRDIDDQ
jgi:hypothetical protein